MNSKQAARQLYCAFRTCSTQEDGTHGPADSCARKGCGGGPFHKAPLCDTFRKDPTVPEPETPLGIWFSQIRAAKEMRAHEFVLKPAETVPVRDILKLIRA